MPAPIGDVSTLTGVYALAVHRMITEKIDDEYKWRFIGEWDALDMLRDIIGTICIAHEDHFEEQAMRFIQFVSEAAQSCAATDCPEKELHTLLLMCATDFVNMPLKVYEESIGAGKLPGLSMN